MDKNLRKIVSEEVSKVLSEKDYDHAAEERAYWDNQYHQEDESQREAVISVALSFMQDLQGSMNKLSEQKNLSNTSVEVDGHLDEALKHINQAIQSYFKTISPEIKNDVLERLGEINIDQ